MLTRQPLLTVLAALVASLPAAMPAAAQEDGLRKVTTVTAGRPMEPLWVQDIRSPLGISDAEGDSLCKAVYGGLRQGIVPDTAIATLANADSPRAVVLSWSDGKAAARSCLGMGATAEEALRKACRSALEGTPSPRQMVWFKLDIVQEGIAVINFSPRDSRLPLPSLFGLSFGPAADFDFLPEQLVSWDMVNPQHQLNVHGVTERVIGQEYARTMPDAERLRAMTRWTTIIGFTGGQKACLFETRSFFHDGARTLTLFRGHPLYENVSVDELRQAALGAGERLVEMCTEAGRFECRLPEWELGKTAGAAARDHTLALLALVRLHQATKDARYLKAAERAARTLVAAIRPYGGTPTAGCLPETEPVAEVAGVVAEARITDTTTNALAVAALCELSEAANTESYHPALALLAQHLILQTQPGGTVVGAREYPSMALRPPGDEDATGAVLLAFAELYGCVAREVFLSHARTIANALRETRFAEMDMDSLPRDVWLLEGLDRLFTFTRDPALCETVERLALAAVLDQSRTVDFPDGYGAVADQPSALPAADRSRLLAVAARLLQDMGRSEGSESLLGEARPFVLFQMQTRITPPDAMYLAEPTRYLGLFRDHVLDFGFELRGQAAQILSLVALSREMERAGRNNLPEDLAVQKSLAEARSLANRWPRYLSAAVAESAAQQTSGQPVEFRNSASETLTIRPRAPKGAKSAKGRKTSPFVPVQPKR